MGVPDTRLRQAIGRQQGELIRDALGRLPPKQAEVFLLRLMEERSYAEIAAIVGCTESTAYSHYSKGMVRLRTLLETSDCGKDER